jgi:heat shock protein HslJ
MRKRTLFSLALLLKFMASLSATASNIHDLKELQSKQRAIARGHSLHATMRESNPFLHDTQQQRPSFSGQGQKLGGDKYINRLLGLNRQTGKKLYRKAKSLGHNLKRSYINVLRFLEKK